jgi:hypothetical protein
MTTGGTLGISGGDFEPYRYLILSEPGERLSAQPI